MYMHTGIGDDPSANEEPDVDLELALPLASETGLDGEEADFFDEEAMSMPGSRQSSRQPSGRQPSGRQPSGRQHSARSTRSSFTHSLGRENSVLSRSLTGSIRQASSLSRSITRAVQQAGRPKESRHALGMARKGAKAFVPVLMGAYVPSQYGYLRMFLEYFNKYRQLWMLCVAINLAGIITAAADHWDWGYNHTLLLAAINVVVGIAARNEIILFGVYWTVRRVFHHSHFWAPLAVRNFMTGLLMHIGGIHSGCGMMSACWYLYFCVIITRNRSVYSNGLLGLTWLVFALLFVTAISAMPMFRYTVHNLYEVHHRFYGWSATAVLWVLIILLPAWNPVTRDYEVSWDRVGKRPEIWLVAVATLMIISPWLHTRKVKVKTEKVSDTIVVMHFAGGVGHGMFGRVARKPLLEWHPFGIVSHGPKDKEHVFVIIMLGDFTKELGRNPPTEIYTRTFKFAGFPYLSTMYRKGLAVATGAGIGVVLGVFFQEEEHDWECIWVGRDIENTFKGYVMDGIHEDEKRRGRKRVFITDTAQQKERPDVLALIQQRFEQPDPPEVVFVTSNPAGTRQICAGCHEMGIPCFGPIWDS